MDFGMMVTGPVGPMASGAINSGHKSPAYTDCMFQARYFPRFAEMQGFDGGYIYAIVDGYYDLVTHFDYDDTGALVVHTIKGTIHPRPDHEFLYSLDKKQGQQA